MSTTANAQLDPYTAKAENNSLTPQAKIDGQYGHWRSRRRRSRVGRPEEDHQDRSDCYAHIKMRGRYSARQSHDTLLP